MTWLLAIPALPVAAFAVMVLMPRTVRNKSTWISIGAILASAVISVVAFFQAVPGDHEDLAAVIWSGAWRLATVDGHAFDLAMRFDYIAAILLPTVAIVGACVQIFSLGYMRHDSRKGWYFAVVSLFTAAMLGLVLANNLLLAFVMWEMMGLCSYLLIGFWFEQDEPRRASQKAFITTRVGDLGFFFALVVIYKTVGTWDLTAVLASVETWAPGVAIAVAAGLLLAAMGKSAQVPLHVWLPDAMAGPTPASALIHAATMVAAGVFIIARTMPIFLAAPPVLTATLIVGLVTALVGGLIACVQYDIKKVLAYSTISQLGLMFVALGVGSVPAALFHLVTHAFFKSLLFLGAGSIIHAVDSQDMREMGGLRKRLPVTWITFLVGSLALAGVAPLSGFFSKDEIIAALLGANVGWAVAGVLTASLLTAFYMTRLYFRVFEGSAQGTCHSERDTAMLAPLALLATSTVIIGWFSPAFSRFIGHEGEWPTIALIATSTIIAALGIGTGWWAYGRRSGAIDTARVRRGLGPVYTALENKLYFDAFNDAAFVRPIAAASRGLAAFDRTGIDGVVNGLATLARATGQRLRELQTGRLQSYQRLIFSAVVIFMAYLMIYAAVKGA
ncbi:MAG: NADH-quinone oxidoreductase subunit L [Coriobacteriia bacterium]|nr:NADH-quinone oxidoreductase subunit L [Coriobacteriia bacterium]